MKYETLYLQQGYNVIEIPQAGQNEFVRSISGAVTLNFGMRTHPIIGKHLKSELRIATIIPSRKRKKIIMRRVTF